VEIEKGNNGVPTGAVNAVATWPTAGFTMVAPLTAQWMSRGPSAFWISVRKDCLL
jgi:hypothetical protein